MIRWAASAVLFLCLVAEPAAPIVAQGRAQQSATPAATAVSIPRAIRRDVPLTNSIRRAFEAGTRDRTGRPGPNYWQLQTDYTINARLDPETATITGKESIAIHNNSPSPLNEIVLRLDHNIFRSLVPRGSSVPAENTDGCVVTGVALNGEALDLAPPQPVVVAPGARPAPRTSVYGLDQTSARIGLATPIPPHATATLDIAWHTKLPGGPDGRGHRMTQRIDTTLFQPTQWYPRLAVFDDLRGWDRNPYLGPAEFYNNFGRFDVTLDVPGGWIVSGTGVLRNPGEVLTPTERERLSHVLASDADVAIVTEAEAATRAAAAPAARQAWHFVADLVNDFAWATAKNYAWKATRATIPGRGPVPIHMVYRPDHAKLYANAGPVARHALEFYSKLWAPFPFAQLTLQDGPSAGMEYPMVINANAGAADHETGHQWWPMWVGTNETTYGWMDEGFDEYMNVLSDADAAHKAPTFNGLGQRYGSISGNEDEASMMWSSNYAGPWYEIQAYMKAPLMLSMLGGIVGDAEVQRAMSEYTKAWGFKHPSPWDFIFFMNTALEQNLDWFWYYWLWTTESVDGSIEKVTTNAGRVVVTVRQDGQMPSPVVLEVQFAATGPAVKPMANAKMLDPTTAVVTWPVDVWFNGSRTFNASLDFGPRAIVAITLDPDGRFPDRNPADNTWKPKGS